MNEPTIKQVKSLYITGHTLTNIMFQPIHIIKLYESTKNLFILAGHQEDIEIQITANGEVF